MAGTSQSPTRHATTATKRMTTAAIISRYRDAVRSQESADYGLAAQPRRDLEGPRFAERLDEPWKVELAHRMARHARSTDPCRGVWPYERFDEALERAGKPIPDHLTLEQAVRMVDAALRTSSVKWYDNNIARPLGRRAAATRVGTQAIDEADEPEAEPRMGLRQPDFTEDLVVLGADLARAVKVPMHTGRSRDQYESALLSAAEVLDGSAPSVLVGVDELDEWIRSLAEAKHR